MFVHFLAFLFENSCSPQSEYISSPFLFTFSQCFNAFFVHIYFSLHLLLLSVPQSSNKYFNSFNFISDIWNIFFAGPLLASASASLSSFIPLQFSSFFHYDIPPYVDQQAYKWSYKQSATLSSSSTLGWLTMYQHSFTILHPYKLTPNKPVQKSFNSQQPSTKTTTCCNTDANKLLQWKRNL